MNTNVSEQTINNKLPFIPALAFRSILIKSSFATQKKVQTENKK